MEFATKLGIVKVKVRVICLCCGVSWPEEAPELCCTCPPNRVPKIMSPGAVERIKNYVDDAIHGKHPPLKIVPDDWESK